MKKTLLSLAILASLGIMSAPAFALQQSTDARDVTIQEGGIDEAADNVIVVDQLGGQYDEIFTVTGGNSFNTLAFFNAGGWFNNSAAVGSQLNFPEAGIAGIGIDVGYGLYALFQSDGIFSISGNVVTFSGGNGYIELWADPDQNTTKTLPGTAGIGATVSNITLGNATEDQLLGTASLLTFGDGSGNTGGGANGNFELIFGDWMLADPDGLAYFVQPRPFYMVLDLNGNFQEFNPTSQTDILLRGNSANAFFAVPEPASIALLGLGLAGIGFSLRRRTV